MTDILMPSLRRVAPLAARRSRRTIHALLERLAVGRLDLVDAEGRAWRYGDTGADPHAHGHAAPGDGGIEPSAAPRAAIHVHDDAVYARVLRGGDVGLGEAYLAREWSSPDLVALLELMMRNRGVLERAVYGSWWGTLAQRAVHALRRNSLAGSRRNVAAHYDLGNDFYRLWLDHSRAR
jgi:cyclopropane-fatty-acyl-phospholipid synthase